MTRKALERIEATAWVISAARRVIEHPGDPSSDALRRALNRYDAAHGATPKYATTAPTSLPNPDRQP